MNVLVHFILDIIKEISIVVISSYLITIVSKKKKNRPTHTKDNGSSSDK